MNPLLLCDFYKVEHFKMYPNNMTKLYSNFTPRKSRITGINKVVVFGIQHFIKEYLIEKFNKEFFIFSKEIRNEYGFNLSKIKAIKKEVIDKYKKHINIDTKHIEDLWDLGYLPLEIKSLDEGVFCPIGVPILTITNTHPDFAWLVNYVETLLSTMLWQPITSATIAYEYKKLLTKYILETDKSNIDFVNWQAHDFSMRGMSSVETSILSGMGHLTSFTGTDTIPAIYQLEDSYNATGLIGASVPATEHSIMCTGTKEGEFNTYKRLLDLYPTGILSIVSDTWDLWNVITNYLPKLKDQILARDGKLVIRPDSGDPVDIICGYDWVSIEDKDSPQQLGVIELLWDIFGGTINKQGYKVLDSHIGAIYGDSITLDRAKEILERLKTKGFASSNIVFGIGSYTYQYNTRDTFSLAMKATYCEIKCPKCKNWEFGRHEICDECDDKGVESIEIFKDPITDDGTKKSKKGRLLVTKSVEKGLMVVDQIRSWEQCENGELTTIFKDGKLVKETTLEEIRNRLKL